jgi:hypothetical protein
MKDMPQGWYAMALSDWASAGGTRAGEALRTVDAGQVAVVEQALAWALGGEVGGVKPPICVEALSSTLAKCHLLQATIATQTSMVLLSRTLPRPANFGLSC